MIKIKRRSEQKKEDTWDLESIYPTKDELDADVNLVKENTTKLEKYKGKILSSASNLLYILDTSFDTERVIEKLFTSNPNNSATISSNSFITVMIAFIYGNISPKSPCHKLPIFLLKAVTCALNILN